MAARLGQVIYWAACIVAGLCVVAGAVIEFSPGNGVPGGPIVITAILAVIVWGVGRATRYVLAGY